MIGRVGQPTDISTYHAMVYSIYSIPEHGYSDKSVGGEDNHTILGPPSHLAGDVTRTHTQPSPRNEVEVATSLNLGRKVS